MAAALPHTAAASSGVLPALSRRSRSALAAMSARRHCTAAACSSVGDAVPAVVAANAALRAVREWLDEDKGAGVDRVVFAVGGPRESEIYEQLMRWYFPSPVDDDDSSEEDDSSSEEDEDEDEDEDEAVEVEDVEVEVAKTTATTSKKKRRSLEAASALPVAPVGDPGDG